MLERNKPKSWFKSVSAFANGEGGVRFFKMLNPLLADFFNRLGLVKRRGSGMKKIMDAYNQYQHLVKCHVPEFTPDASEFHVTLWNQNYVREGIVKDDTNGMEQFANKGEQFAKEFVKASRQIYKMISQNPQISAV